jgi:glucokinase
MFAYFDIGGTKTRVAVSSDGSTFGEPVKFDTPQRFEDGVRAVLEVIHRLAAGATLTAAGGGIAGPLNAERACLVRSPHLSDWVGKPLQQMLSEELHAPVYLENDSALVALGEAHYGAGKGDDIMAYLTVSTGIGGVRVVQGKLDVGVFGFEPGHQYIDFDKSACPECVGGEAEQYLSGTATAKRFGCPAYEVHDPAVWEALSEWLAYVLNNTIVHWSPRSVVLGGSMIVGDPAIPVDRVAHHLDRICTIFPEKPTIKKATLKDMGGIYGAMAYVRQKTQEMGA